MSEFQIGDKVVVTVSASSSVPVGSVLEVVEYINDNVWITNTQAELSGMSGWNPDQFAFVKVNEQPAQPDIAPLVGNPKYNREIKPGVYVDVYDVLYAFKVTDPCLQHAIKKALAAGQRGHKDTRQDLVDIRDSAQRALDSFDIWEAAQ